MINEFVICDDTTFKILNDISWNRKESCHYEWMRKVINHKNGNNEAIISYWKEIYSVSLCF